MCSHHSFQKLPEIAVSATFCLLPKLNRSGPDQQRYFRNPDLSQLSKNNLQKIIKSMNCEIFSIKHLSIFIFASNTQTTFHIYDDH
jgi:hypothetical protein